MKGLKIKDTSMKAQQGQYGIVFTSWNPSIVQDLLKEAKKELISQGVDEANIYLKEVPGAFELPLATQFMAEKEGILSVIALGAIIRGVLLILILYPVHVLKVFRMLRLRPALL